MDKIIIQNDSGLSICDCLVLVQRIVKMGRISNNNTQYAYLTCFNIDGSVYHVVSDINKRSDKFTIYKASTPSPTAEIPQNTGGNKGVGVGE